MRNTILAAVAALFCSVVLTAQTSTTVIDGLRSKNTRLIAFTNVTVVTEPGTRIENATILIRNERIEAVGTNVSIPAGADVRDARGQWVYAGFIDPIADVKALAGGGRGGDSHNPWEDEGPNTPPATGAQHWNQAVRPERRATAELRVSDAAVRDLRSMGVTAVGAASQDGIFRGSAAVALLREGTASTTVIANDVYQGLSFRKGSSKTPYPSSQMGSIALIRQTLSDAVWYKNAHDVAQRIPTATPPEQNLSLEALSNALTAKKLFVAEMQDEHDIARWYALAQDPTFALAFKGTGQEYRRLAQIAATKPTIILPLTLPKVPDVRDASAAHEVSLQELIHWYWAADNARLLDSAGCTLAVTVSGVKDASAALATLRMMVQRGWDPKKALAALTTVPARIVGTDDRLGRIAPGYYANLVFTTGDLFDEKTVIRSVAVAGQTYDIKPSAAVDIRGTWALTSTLLRSPLKVTVSGAAEAPSTTFKRDSITVSGGLSLQRARVTFHLDGDTLGIDGTIRGAGAADSIMMTGTLTAPDGSTAAFVMRRDSVFTEKKSTPPPALARRALPKYLPLGAYGLDSLPPQRSVLLKNATVWACAEKPSVSVADVLIKNGVIAAVGTGLSGADTTIDCTGKHITPGILDEHSHIAITRGVNEGTHAVTAEVRIGDVLEPDDINIYRQLAGGVTSSHLLHGSANPMGGQLQLIKLRWGADAEGLRFQNVTPTIKFALGENVKQSNWGDNFRTRYPQTRMGVEEIMRDAFRAAVEYDRQRTEAGAGLTRVPVRKDYQLETLLEIIQGKRYIHCHSYVQSEILMLIRLAEEFNFKVKTFTHILEGYKVADEMAKHGAGGSSFADWWAYKFEVYDAITQNPAIMHEQGVLVSINSDDAEMARRLNQEAAKSVKYGGVSDTTALKFVTLNAAKQLAVDDRIGSIEVGKQADVVVWSGHPLSNTTRAERTFVDGRQYFSIEQDRALHARDMALRAFLEQQALEALDGGAPSQGGGRGPRREYDCEDIDDEMAGEAGY
jgi:imidazolonepropionase-like amidohydrolase